jgi:hypothetical protein
VFSVQGRQSVWMVINQRMGVERNKLLPARSLWKLISKVRRLEGDTVDGSEITGATWSLLSTMKSDYSILEADAVEDRCSLIASWPISFGIGLAFVCLGWLSGRPKSMVAGGWTLSKRSVERESTRSKYS